MFDAPIRSGTKQSGTTPSPNAHDCRSRACRAIDTLGGDRFTGEKA
jgi:hypothetical protein